jgi:hypothetical protein
MVEEQDLLEAKIEARRAALGHDLNAIKHRLHEVRDVSRRLRPWVVLGLAAMGVAIMIGIVRRRIAHRRR